MSVIILFFIDKITPANIIIFFIIVYDIEFIGIKVEEYYKNKSLYENIGLKLNRLNEIII